MSKLFFRLLPAALSYLVLRVCLTLARLLSDGRGPLDGAVIYILAAGLGYAAAIYLLRRLCTHDTDAAEFQPEIIAEGAAIDVDGTAAAAGTVQGARMYAYRQATVRQLRRCGVSLIGGVSVTSIGSRESESILRACCRGA